MPVILQAPGLASASMRMGFAKQVSAGSLGIWFVGPHILRFRGEAVEGAGRLICSWIPWFDQTSDKRVKAGWF